MQIAMLMMRYTAALLVCALLTLGLITITPPFTIATVALLYQLSILFIAMISGRGPGIFAAMLSVLAFNTIFLSPPYSQNLASGDELLQVLTFVGVALTTGGLAQRAQAGAALARQRVAELTALYELGQLISTQRDLDQILQAVATTTCRLLRVPACSVWLADAEGHLIEHSRVGEAVAQLQSSDVLILDGPLLLGVIRVVERTPGAGFSTHERYLLETLAGHAHRALSQARLMAQHIQSQALARSDQLKSALIASVSHDLRTPLAAIKGAVSTLHLNDMEWEPAQQRELTHMIEREADRLNRLIGNLLAMSRIEAGALPLERDWHDAVEIIQDVLQRMAPALQKRCVTVEVAADMPFVWCNAGLIDHVLTNLVENALKYTPPTSPLHFTAGYVAMEIPEVHLTLRDYGPGIAASELMRIFEKFVRATPPDLATSGSGLGLTICQGIVEAHGGRIWAENCPDGGAQFTLTLPLPPAASVEYKFAAERAER